MKHDTITITIPGTWLVWYEDLVQNRWVLFGAACVALALAVALVAGFSGSRTRVEAKGDVAAPAPAQRKIAEEPVANTILEENPWLLPRLEATLPPGTDFRRATAGFKDVQEFLTALNVSQNLSIPLDHLKTALHGPPPAKTLAKAINQLNPNVLSAGEVKRAQMQMRAELKQHGVVLMASNERKAKAAAAQ